MPSLLGVCDDDVFDPDAVARSTADVEAARALARVFVATRAYRAALAALTRHGFAVLTGPSEMGKTASARMIGLAKLSARWEFHECIRPEQLWAAYRRDRAQIFVADDAFGSTEYRPDAAEHWAVELDRVLRAMDAQHWLVWTSRPAPLKAGLRRIHREHGVERFPRPAEVQVDAAALEVDEKALILFRHARAAGLSEELRRAIRPRGWEIVSHEHFTPERIRRFVHAVGSPREIAQHVESGIREPTTAMSASFHVLEPAQRAVLLALLDSPAGAVNERELASAVRRHAGTAIGQRPEQLLDRLTDHFIRVGEAGAVTWVHPSWRDLVIDELVADGDVRRRFLANASLEGLLLALSTAGGAAGERVLPLLLADADWDVLGDRFAKLAPELDEPDLKRVLVALREALASVDDRRRPELEALAVDVLQRRRTLFSVGVLADWFAVHAALQRVRPPLPDAAGTWIEYLPVGDAFDPSSPADLADLGEWVALVELLLEHAPQLLDAFGYPHSVANVLASLLRRFDHERTVADPRAVFDLLRRLRRSLPPSLAAEFVFDFAYPPAEPAETYVPHALSSEMAQLLAPAPPVDSRPSIVWRVLDDL